MSYDEGLGPRRPATLWQTTEDAGDPSLIILHAPAATSAPAADEVPAADLPDESAARQEALSRALATAQRHHPAVDQLLPASFAAVTDLMPMSYPGAVIKGLRIKRRDLVTMEGVEPGSAWRINPLSRRFVLVGRISQQPVLDAFGDAISLSAYEATGLGRAANDADFHEALRLNDAESRLGPSALARKWGMAEPSIPGGLDGLPPTLNAAAERRASVLEDTPARFDIWQDPTLDGRAPLYRLGFWGKNAVIENDVIIEAEARRQGVDPDLVRAIVYLENSQGYYDEPLDWVDLNSSIRPMNINPNLWADLGINRETAQDPRVNIRVGVTLLRRLMERTDDPSPEKIGSLYNSIGAEYVNEYGERIRLIYAEKPWE